ncbi:glycosyltransferase [Formosa sp. S-31]|uniref:glycosyltransferase n=1 Tax=Formosa sp. S-31 TaxID=2790949 RepID=UPI003EB8A0D1
MLVNFIILNYNSAIETIELYDKIKTSYKFQYRISVIDNASDDFHKKLLIDKIAIEDLIINKVNLGYSAGNKLGIMKAIDFNIPYVFLLNPDIRIEESTVQHLLNEIEKDPKIAAIGPRICYRSNLNRIYSDGGIIDLSYGVFTTHLNYNKLNSEVKNLNTPHIVDYVNGSVFLARTSVFKEIGFMLNDFFLYFEETEWCIRAKNNGYKLMVDSRVSAYHLSSKKGKTYYYYMERNRLLMAKLLKINYSTVLFNSNKDIVKELIKCIKQRKFPDDILKARIKGCLAGFFQRIKN